MSDKTDTTTQSDSLREVIEQYWGYDDFRPLQEAAMLSVVENRDSLVVLPTGGGKSLCYQVPAMTMEGLAIVVSPLISLMKDQVDALRACGIPAAYLNSTLSWDESRDIFDEMRAGTLKLLYVAPERLMNSYLLEQLVQCGISFVAIDEAHCVSMWGHDFRPHYRELQQIREVFPEVAVHAYTATATEQVRQDIVNQLTLQEPEILVGSFDRPNLSYSVEQINDRIQQIRTVVDRHPDESGIVYCISRKEVENVANTLNEFGYRALPYHAGLPDDERSANQESFIEDRTDIIVATIAFGMGVDKPNVRYVIHAGLPKSLENYQQESGRAGRDNLEAECCLFYSEADLFSWERILSDQPDQVRQASLNSIRTMLGYCHAYVCRHQQLVTHFGQVLEETCGHHCDVCRGDFEPVEEPLVLSQKILSSVYRQDQRFGTSYTAAVLKGSRDKKVLANGHNSLSTYGLLKSESLATIRNWINQLVAQEFLHKEGEEFQVLKLTETGWQVLKGERTPTLIQPRIESKAERASRQRQDVEGDAWDGVDHDLFQHLRQLRFETAEQQGLKPYMVFSDETLRGLARHRPSTSEHLLEVKGIGQKKSEDYGERFLTEITTWCQTHQLSQDIDLEKPVPRKKAVTPTKKLNETVTEAFNLFADGKNVYQIAEELGRAATTVSGYLSRYIQYHQLTNATPWVDEKIVDRIETAIDEVGDERLRPIYDYLNEEIDYEPIRIVVECRRQRESQQTD
ncbi:MAG: DNA helicase RecQ [Planctomycetaceae bacterium]|nr:DNA helicase RecQ [Planctomycetaceae bacterium]